MRQIALVAIVIVVGAVLRSTDASACSFAVRHHSEQEIKQMAEQALASATVVVDGEVISPMLIGPTVPEGTMPMAAVRVTHTWKGRLEDSIIPVVYLTSCDVTLETKGQKVRILLSGTGVFTASQFNNGFEAVFERNAFNQEIDRLLGAARPPNFALGEPPPPDKPKR